MERAEKETTVGAEDGAIEFEDLLDLGNLVWFVLFGGVLKRRISLENPTLDFIFGDEAEFGVERLAERGGIELHGGDPGFVEMLDRLVKELGADALAAEIRIDQNHTDPGEAAFVGDRRGSTNDFRIALHDETTVGALLEEAQPVCGGLIPAADGVETEAAGDILVGHDAKVHGKVPEGL